MTRRTEAEIMKNWHEDHDGPLVTVLAISYCHEKYLRTALDGILSQETDFPFEVIVHDDASPDGSADIIREYAENYPEIIRPILQVENQFSKGIRTLMRAVKPYIRGRYLAYLDCDDYWTDVNKLQEQVDYLEAHPAFIAVAHNCTVVGADGAPIDEQYPECRDEEFTPEHFFNDILAGQLSTLVVRDIFTKSPEDHQLLLHYPPGPMDRVLNLTLLQNGRIHCIQKTMSAYRHVTDSGTSYSATVQFDIRRDARFYLSFVNYCKKMGRIGDAIGMLRWLTGYIEYYKANASASSREADSLLAFCHTSISSLTDRLTQRSYRCSCCEQQVRYKPMPIDQQEKSLSINGLFIPETLNPDAYICPVCGSLDRDRLMIVALKRMDLHEKGEDYRILQVAPSAALDEWLTLYASKATYETCDLSMAGVDFHIDLQDMSSIPDASYDLIICSHVMEHIRDDRRALREMKRILKDDGCVLFLVPIDLMFSGIDEAFELSQEDNWLRFGQEDHLRRYSCEGLLERLEEEFYVQTLEKDFFGEDCFRQAGLSDSSTLYVLTKPEHAAYFDEAESASEKKSCDSRGKLTVYVRQLEDTYYTEEKSVHRNVVLEGQYSCLVPLSDFGEITNLRIDPMDNYCVLRNISVNLFTAKGEKVSANILQTNAASFQDAFIFDTDDPQIEVSIPRGIYKSVLFSSELVSSGPDDIDYFKQAAIIDDIKELSDEKEKYRILSEKRAEQIQSLSKELQEANEEYRSAANQRDDISREYGIMQSTYREVVESHCWKMTGPIRWFGDRLKGIFRKGSSRPIDDIGYLKNMEGKKIAVHVHLFYEDLLEEFCGYLDNIPFPFDIFVSLRDGVNPKRISRRLKKIKNVRNVTVEKTINRGRDIAPLYVQFGERIRKYDYFLHMHSKKSLFTGTEQKEWRHYSLDTLLGSEERVRKIFALLCDPEKNIGLVYPETRNLPLIAHSWLSNRIEGKHLLERMDLPFEDGFYNYPVGSFFWAKIDAVHDLFDTGFQYDDFPVETGQTDGTTAHALERVVAFVNKNNGYHSAIIDDEEGGVRFDVSLKIFRGYFALQYESAQNHLARFDLVSFDIFDTLISRSVCRPDDMFRLMEKRISRELGIKCDFLSVRKAAEEKANIKKGKYTNIHDIYEAIPEVSSELGKFADTIMEWELDMELDLCFPREDMLKVYDHVRAGGIRIILISDMYLPKVFLEKMLSKCGYEGYEDIWVSCERGERKDDGSMWETFYGTYGSLKTVHCGDNAHSDMQLSGDYKKDNFFILNPFDGTGISDLNPLIKKWSAENTSVSTSISLGLVINKRIFNSPFVLGENGRLVINDPFEFGYSAVGPLLAYFTEWLADNCESKKLLFLSREGYIFKQVFDIYREVFKNTDIDSVYFLASRRAVSLAAIRSAEDVRELLMTYYEGPLFNLTVERLGVDVTGKATDKNVAMPQDIDEVMELLSSYMPEILERASVERAAYEKYISETVDDISNAMIVDVGYSGTIQYFLSKMLDLKIDGLYLSTSTDRRPEKLGCNCISAFPVTDPSEKTTNLIFKNQLFLEAILKAPFGQLIRFDDSEGGVRPVYNRDDEIPMDLKLMQKGAVAFAEEYWKIISKYASEEKLDGESVSELFDFMINGDVMGQRIAGCLNVSDDYCSNGKWRYSFEEKKFIIKEKS